MAARAVWLARSASTVERQLAEMIGGKRTKAAREVLAKDGSDETVAVVLPGYSDSRELLQTLMVGIAKVAVKLVGPAQRAHDIRSPDLAVRPGKKTGSRRGVLLIAHGQGGAGKFVVQPGQRAQRPPVGHCGGGARLIDRHVLRTGSRQQGHSAADGVPVAQVGDIGVDIPSGGERKQKILERVDQGNLVAPPQQVAVSALERPLFAVDQVCVPILEVRKGEATGHRSRRAGRQALDSIGNGCIPGSGLKPDRAKISVAKKVSAG